MTTPQTLLRQLPSMNDLLAQAEPLIAHYGRELTTESLRTDVAHTRQAILAHEQTTPPTAEQIHQQAAAWLAHLVAPTLLPVINATGVIVHTNLGRAPLSAATRAAITAVAQDYNTLEYDLSAGQRGSRTLHAERLLRRVT
ncbi:MAG: L-seryl-tRNA(Sec) selenium transferase, partial [Anaerolineales bacterium]|nr:L-seryl-tRNA(Sec) selenium transferase [Anaerolineales bacterium]